jgi:hypothetical protein
MHEKRVIRPRTDNPDLDSILWVPPGESVETIEALSRVKVIASALPVYRKCAEIERDVDGPPPNLVLRRALFHNAFVFGRTPGLDARVGYERAVLGNMGILLVEDSMLVEGAGSKVAVDFLNSNFVLLQVE